MAEEQNQQGLASSGELLAWEYPERPYYERGKLWYLVMVTVGLALLIYAVYSANFLFALIIIMFALVIYIMATVKPAPSRFAITEKGVEIGDRTYRFRDIDRFWFFYEPPVKALYMHVKSGLGDRIRVDLMDQDPNEVREVLNQFVPEDLEEDDEPLSDVLSRLFKI